MLSEVAQVLEEAAPDQLAPRAIEREVPAEVIKKEEDVCEEVQGEVSFVDPNDIKRGIAHLNHCYSMFQLLNCFFLS